MTDFIEWLGSDAPGWVLFVVCLLLAVIIIVAVMLSIVAITQGYWIVPVMLFIVAPAYLVVSEYHKLKGG